MTMRNMYLAGAALLTTAAAIDAGLVPALVTAGGALMFYAFCVAIAS
jgi:hypothetical protein